MATSALLAALSHFERCDHDLSESVRKTLLAPLEGDRLTKKDLEVYQKRLTPLAMSIINQNLASFSKLHDHAGNSKTAQDSEMIACLIDTSFYALRALHLLNDTKAVKHLDVEKARSNLITKLININQYNRAIQELTSFREHLANLIGVNPTSHLTQAVGGKALEAGEKSILTEALNSPTTPASPRAFKSTARQLTAELYKAATANSARESHSEHASLLQLPMQQNMNNISMVRLILAYQLNAIRCFVEMDGGARISELPDLLERKGSFFDWCRHLATMEEEKAQEQFEYLYRLLSKAAKGSHSVSIPPLQALKLRVQSLAAAYFFKRAKFGYICDQLVRIGVTFEKANSQVPLVVKFSSIQQHCEYILKYIEPTVNDLAGMENYFVLCEYYAYVSRKAGSYQGSFYAFKHMMRPLRIVLQDPQNCQSYHFMYAASAKMSLASIQLDKMISSNAYADINTTLCEISSCIKFSIVSLENNLEMTKYNEQAMRNVCKSVDNFRSSCNAMHAFLTKKMEENITKREVEHDPYQTPPQRKYMHPDDFGEWKNNSANIYECLVKCTELVPICLRLLTTQNEAETQTSTANTDTISLTYIDVVILLSRMVFRTEDPETHDRAFEFLREAESFCESNGFTEGKRWVSSAYYSFGANLATEGEYGKAITPLEKSCTILEQDQLRAKTQSEQWSMQLCKRYELLGASHLKIFNQRKAISALQNALAHLPKASINEFVRHCDSISLTIIIDKFPLIPKLMERYIRAAIIDPPGNEAVLASDAMDIGRLSCGQQAIIKECELQIMNVMSLRSNVSALQMMLIEQLLEAYDGTAYPIRRARILIEKCRLLRSRGDSAAEKKEQSELVIEEALSLLKGDVFVNDSELLDYRRHYLSMCYSWKGICKQDDMPTASDSFSMALRCWGTILKPIPLLGEETMVDDEAKGAIYRQVDGIDRLYGHLRMLSDLFSVNRRRIQRLSVLRLLLQLNNGLRDMDADHISDGVFLCTEITNTYLDLGYTGKAAMEFERAERILKLGKCDIDARLNHMLMYAQYLAITGDIDQSTQVYQHAKQLGDKCAPIRSVGKYKSAQNKLSRSMLLANASFARSYLSIELASVDDAVNDATTALRILSRLSSSLFHKSASRAEKGQELSNPFTSEGKRYENSVPEEQQSHGIVQTVADIALQDAHWGMAQKLSNCFARLGLLHGARGSWREAEYFLKQGLQLAEQLGSAVAASTYLVLLADLYWKIDKYEESQNNLEKALELQSMDQPFPKDQADLKIIVGDVDGSQGYNEAAMESYQDADNILSNLMERTYISGLEHSLARTKQSTPRTVKLLQELKEPRISQSTTDTEYDCVLLHSHHANVIIREALLIASTGDVASGFAKLEDLESTMTLFSNEASKLNSAFSKLKLQQTMSELQEHKLGHHLNQNGLSLPILKSASSRMPVRRTMNAQSLKATRDNVKQAIERLMEALSAGVDKLEMHIVNDICLSLTSSLFLKSLLSTTGMFLTNETAVLSAYYLEMSKGISFRREMQACLSHKLRRTPSENEDKWPAAVYADTERSAADEDAAMFEDSYEAHLEQLRDLYKEEHELDETGFQTKFVDILPAHWTVCSLTMDTKQGDLYVSRLQANCTPLLLKLPLQRFARRNGEGGDMSYKAVIYEFNSIISASNETMRSNQKFENKADIDKWWSTRHELDSRLKQLMEKIDENWFGGFKGILAKECTVVDTVLKKFQGYLSDLICKAAHGRAARSTVSMANKPKLLEVSLDVCKMILQLSTTASHTNIEDIAYYLLSLYDINDIDVNYSELDIGQLKDDITLGIRHYHDAVKKVEPKDSASNVQSHTILILDKYTQQLPIESLSALKGRSVSRLPCLSFLRDRVLYARSINQTDDAGWTDINLNGDSAFYVLNPSGDLKKTQAEFQSVLENRRGWQGTIGRPPMEQQIQNALKQKDIYIYFGHSGGETFIRGHTVRQVKRCAVSLLIGCSSGLMKPAGQYDPYGYVTNYLLAGCPAVVANLWDVTDKSIDRFTKSMMIRWGLLPPPGNQNPSLFRGVALTEAVAQARYDCPMQYLIGAAPVVYGIPVYLDNDM